MKTQTDVTKRAENQPVKKAGRRSLLLKTTLVGAGLLAIGAHELSACDCYTSRGGGCHGNVSCTSNADGGCTCNGGDN
jgi:hypothetical protein